MVSLTNKKNKLMRLIHISDLHISREFKRNNIKKLKQLLNHAMQLSFDHLVITGDLTDSADERDFKLLRQILKNFDLLDSRKLSIVVGNHDIFGGLQIPTDIIDFPRKCKSINYDAQVSNFISYFEELFTDCKFVSPQKFFPYYKDLGEVGIFGINSIARYSKIRNPMASMGKVSSEQLNDFSKLVSNNNSKNQASIALIHHHFYKKNIQVNSPQNSVWHKIESYTLRLRSKKKLIKIFRECGINLVLHGHSHDMRQYSRKGIHFINAGASIESNSSHPSFYVIDYLDGIFNVNFEKISRNSNLIYQPAF